MEDEARIPTDISVPASLLADRARAAMLMSLLEGGEMSSSALAARARVSASGASNHLRLLAEGGLVEWRGEGRHRFFRLAGPAVARVVEALVAVAPRTPGSRPAGDEFRSARTCYDHLAGRLGVALTDELLRSRYLSRRDPGYGVTRLGAEFLRQWGLDPRALRARHRAFAIPCLDGTERRNHLGGALGAGLASRIFDLGWVVRLPAGRALRVTASGRSGLKGQFGLEV
jgi:DNA-binding transcriptional ArsR family regulator